MHIYTIGTTWDFPSGTVINNLPVNVGDVSLIPVSGRSPGGGNGNPLHYACLGNPKTGEPGKLQSIGLQELDTS